MKIVTNSLFGVNIFNALLSFTSFLALSSGGISGISLNLSESLSAKCDEVSNKFLSLSSPFCFLNFTLSAVVSSGCDLLFYFFFNSINL